MKRAAFALLCAVLVLKIAGEARGAPDEAVPAYAPAPLAGGDIRVWGSPADGPLLSDWADGFRRFHAGVRIIASLHGPDSTLAGLYTGVADLAFMAREIRLPVEHMAFTWVRQYPPFSVEIANAGIRTGRPGANLAVFVHKSNPLVRLTLAQLDAVLGSEHRRGDRNVRTWGELLPDPDASWSQHPIDVYGPVVDSIPAQYVRRVVLKDSYKWNPDYREFADDGREALAVLAGDPWGIAYAPLLAANDEVRPLALAEADGGAFVDLTEANVMTRAYPLTRVITMVLDRAPAKPVEPKVREFLRFILSREGQDAIVRDGAYVPLDARSLGRQLARLD